MMKEKFAEGQKVYFFDGNIVSKAAVVRSITEPGDNMPFYLVKIDGSKMERVCLELRLFSDVQLLREAIAEHIYYLKDSSEFVIHEASSWLDKG
jgi:hypothetical protein